VLLAVIKPCQFLIEPLQLDSSPTAASTTNPTKIRNALSQPQRVWSLRKGHWDGIKSVGVGENGSVIICTQAGAVWRRIGRPKIKITYLSVNGDSKSKDYKFQRVPGLTKVAAVRSNIFGAYAALRKDCDVTKTQIVVNKQNLWTDMAPLFSLRNLKVSELQDAVKEASRFWMPALSKEQLDPFKRAVLISTDLEADVSRFIRNTAVDLEEYDVDVCTTLSETSIPAHGFIIGARSSLLRDALSDYRKSGSNDNTDLFTISGEKKLMILFSGLDFLTILNLALYAYTDKIIDVWHFTRHAPKSAFRYRQVRSELMKVASKLGMIKLESAVRLMSEPEPRLNLDLALAFEDQRFFEDGDAVVELDGGSMTVHSALIRQRCPFFEGLFNGRAAGQWILGRREAHSDAIRIDMKHIDPAVFKHVLRYLYADVGAELFDGIVSADIDEFCDVVMDVLSVANELMLDRLSQICQQVIGRFVNTRNVCQLINSVAPCSVTEFKDAGLEYICLQLEAMLENYLLNELDEDLMLELDEVVRGNQLACLPFAKSGRSELLLHERHPSLAGDIDEERHRKIRDMVFRNAIKEEDSRLSSSLRTRVGSVDDIILSSPSQEKFRKKVKTSRNAPFSPAIHPRDSAPDLIFDMDDDDAGVLEDPVSPRQIAGDSTLNGAFGPTTPTPSKDVWHDVRDGELAKFGKHSLTSPKLPLLASTTMSPRMTAEVSSTERASTGTSIPWSSTTLPSSKLDMKEIMAQASRGRTSTLSMSLSAENAEADAAAKAATPKMSQKERKKQQQQALQQAIPQPVTNGQSSSTARPLTPWQVPRTGPTLSLKDVLSTEASTPSPSRPVKSSMSPVALTQNTRRTASPDTRFSGQQRSKSALQGKVGGTASPSYGTFGTSPQPPAPRPVHLNPQSHSYINPAGKAEPMADIIGQQKREQDIIKEAVAKRSLQEIQEEQAFQEWWDQESRRTQEEEAMRARASTAVTSNSGGGARGKGGRRGRRGAQKGEGQRGRGESSQSWGRCRGRGTGLGQGQSHGATAT
jgi:inhibitor of Bruton tyrosine kinase